MVLGTCTSKCFYIPNLANALANIFKFWWYSYSLFGFLLYFIPCTTQGWRQDISAKYPTPVPSCYILLNESPLYLRVWFSQSRSSVLLGIFFCGFIMRYYLNIILINATYFIPNLSNINQSIKDWPSLTGRSPTVSGGKSFNMLLLLLQLLLYFYSSVKNRAIEVLANNLIVDKSLAVVAFCCHLALLSFQNLTLVFFLKVDLNFFVLAVFAYHWFWLSFAALTSFSFGQETSQCTFLINFGCVS